MFFKLASLCAKTFTSTNLSLHKTEVQKHHEKAVFSKKTENTALKA